MLYLKAGTTKQIYRPGLKTKKFIDMVKVIKQNPVSKRNGVLKIFSFIISNL